jgi:hypothetical protein
LRSGERPQETCGGAAADRPTSHQVQGQGFDDGS